MALACMAANGTGSVVLIDDATADRSIAVMESEVYRATLSAHSQPNTVKLIGRYLTVQTDNGPKILQKQTKSFSRQNN